MEQREQLRSFLAAVRRRWFAQELLTVLSRAAAAASVPALAALLVYWLLAPEGLVLAVLAVAAILAAVVAAVSMLRAMHPRPDDRQVARFVEERAAALPTGVAFQDSLVTAADGTAASQPSFGPLLVATAVQRLRGVAPEDIVPPDRLRRGMLDAAAGLLVLGVTLAFAVAPLSRAAQAAWMVLFPESIHVEIAPGDIRVVAGEPVTIRAIVRAGERVLTRTAPSLTVSAGGEQRSVPMTADGEAFVFPFESVDRTFQYSVTAGTARSPEFTVTALFPPRVERLDLLYRYPSFTGLGPREEEDGGDIYAPAGTRVRVRVHTDKPVVSGELSFHGGNIRGLDAAGARTLETELVLAEDDSYRLRLSDADGLTATGDTEYFIRLMDDRPPGVRILRPAGDQRITPLEEVLIEARADDDHGIASLELVYSVAGRAARAVPFARLTTAGSARLGAHVLAAEELGVKPGDVITYYARARDVGRGKRPTEARSDMYFLEVRPFGEEFVAAQSQAGAGGSAGARIESLIAAQKEIISATWNVERRSGAGRSSQDVAAIAQAQAELKARAEQLASRRGRGSFGFPQQILPDRSRGRAQAGEGVATALAAMSRAVDQLERERTKEALSHEMAALQALLAIQAEIRRRQVAMQQASGGSSGAGRSGEDLSALFDKELQRQQSTRYETRTPLDGNSEREDQQSALDRIRDLARRQEELSRRQRELSDDNLETEERKRQLERLTREQRALQQQLEELARRTESARSEPARGGQKQGQGQEQGQGQRSEQGQGLREAAEQMRTAAGALGREDVKAAAERAEQAASQLRRIEQHMRGEDPQARQRAAGEVQLEALQIAQEQRRIASEAARLDKIDPSASADARRRLAGDKDQLADRLDNLQRAAQALSARAAAGGEEAGAASKIGEAARELEKQELGRRMRETADAMREGTNRTAPAEEQLAQAVDRVAEGLGGGSAETRQLTGLLDDTRAMRDRLDRFERQIKEAEAQETSGKGGQPSRAALEALRKEYGRELQQARRKLADLERSRPRTGAGGSTPEGHEWSHADPGTEAFKQDFSGWESLRREINLALERTEAAASARLARQAAQDRLSAGGSDRVPDAYERLIARYYESLARGRK